MDETWWREAGKVDPDQTAIYALPPDGKYLILGPPGSGKTNVLLLRAVYLTKAGRANFKVLTFTRTLTEFIRSGAASNGKLPMDRIKTMAEWQFDLYKSLTGQTMKCADGEHDEERRERLSLLRSAVQRAQIGKSYYDCLLIDEVQDLWREEVELIGGLANNLFFVGDNRQRIYGRNEGLPAAQHLGCTEKSLKYHYRLGRRICEVADKVLADPSGVPLLKYSQYDEIKLPSSANLHTLPSREMQVQEIVNRIQTQLRAYPGEWIGIITHRNKCLEFLLNEIQKTPLKDKVTIHSGSHRRFVSERPIVALTAHSSKGTEFRAVHVFAAEDFNAYYTRELAFTVVTRAKTSLDVYHTNPIEGSLHGALASERVPDPKEVF